MRLHLYPQVQDHLEEEVPRREQVQDGLGQGLHVAPQVSLQDVE